MTISQDGYAANSGGGNQTTATVTLTTTKSNDIILFSVFNESIATGTGPHTITGVSGAA